MTALSALGKYGLITQGAGAASSLIGAYYSSRSEQYKYKSQALTLEHQKDMALFNMRMKESQAQHLNRVFNKQYQILTLKQGAAKSTARASFAARGIQMGVGSTKDAFVSSELMAQLDRITMNSNKVRAVESKRLEGVGLGIKATMLGLSADNMFATASSINPWMNMASSLFTGAGNIISSMPSSMLTKTDSGFPNTTKKIN